MANCDETIYWNPWQNLSKTVSILKINDDGFVENDKINTTQLWNNDFNDTNILNVTINKNTTDIKKHVKRKKLRILTNCNSNALCKYLFCLNVNVGCRLCETTDGNIKKKLQCTDYTTKDLMLTN